ncbi:aminotransferase [Beggiatoa sp. PS]|nr:aminotransferase [Beggiatoa sp. PS]
MKEYLATHHIQTGIHYPIPLPKLKAYQYTNQANEHQFINQVDHQLLSLPIGEHLSMSDIETITLKIKDFFK